MNRFAKAFLFFLLIPIISSVNACSGGNQIAGTTPNPTTPTVSVTPASSSITTAQSLSVTVTVSGTSGTPTGSVVLSSGSYTSAAAALSSGSAILTIPAGSLAAAANTLSARYTPDSASTAAYNSASGTAAVTVTQSAKAPTVTVTPEETTHPYAENLIVTVTAKDGSASPTGTVTLSSSSFTTQAVTLNSGAATFYIQPGSLAKGADTLTVTYTPDSGSASNYTIATGTASITITSPGSNDIAVNINTLANRHLISPYIYGINTFNTDSISNIGPNLVRFGGNEASNYNWKLHTYNSGGDWFFEDFGLTYANGSPVDSVALTQYAVNKGSHMLTTMPTLDWVAKEPGNWSFSVKKFGAQCKVDPWNSDAGNSQKPDCQTPVTTQQVTDAYYPLVDTAGDCTTGNCLYRDEWANALSAAFGTATCNVPYSAITSCHFYDLDNEPEIWDGSHRDVHPDHPGYTELANRFLTTGTALKTWDPGAVRFGPIPCCWNFF
jgi:hypothetical protein